ncbi:MAG: hypothetical protein IH851_09500 [Armatimonadetes bacterium]|nr:hypothetical protein [Armatimonadota bacterium]
MKFDPGQPKEGQSERFWNPYLCSLVIAGDEFYYGPLAAIFYFGYDIVKVREWDNTVTVRRGDEQVTLRIRRAQDLVPVGERNRDRLMVPLDPLLPPRGDPSRWSEFRNYEMWEKHPIHPMAGRYPGSDPAASRLFTIKYGRWTKNLGKVTTKERRWYVFEPSTLHVAGLELELVGGTVGFDGRMFFVLPSPSGEERPRPEDSVRPHWWSEWTDPKDASNLYSFQMCILAKPPPDGKDRVTGDGWMVEYDNGVRVPMLFDAYGPDSRPFMGQRPRHYGSPASGPGWNHIEGPEYVYPNALTFWAHWTMEPVRLLYFNGKEYAEAKIIRVPDERTDPAPNYDWNSIRLRPPAKPPPAQ